MPNYKPIQPPSIDYGGYQHQLKGNDVLVHLRYAGTVIENKSMKDSKTGLVYFIASDKKFKIIFVDEYTDGGLTVDVTETSSVNGGSGNILIDKAQGAYLNNRLVIIDPPSERYITIRQTATATYAVELTGIESDF